MINNSENCLVDEAQILLSLLVNYKFSRLNIWSDKFIYMHSIGAIKIHGLLLNVKNIERQTK